MRNIDPALRAKLDAGATTMCRAWIVERRDGMRFGFTDHDREIVVDGVTCAAGSGLTGSAIETGTGLAVDNSEAAGALNAAGLTEQDIISGAYDRAEIWQWLVDWSDTELRILLFRGFLGEITRGQVGFSAEMRGLTEELNRAVGRSFTFECPRTLGDAKCRFDLNAAGYRVQSHVITADAGRRIVVAPVALQDGWFTHGVVKWLDGANVGFTASIKSDKMVDGDRTIELWMQAPLSIGIGDELELTVGCDKKPDTCAAKFDNIANFRGFPHLPGEQWVVSYPAEGSVHDGSSRQS